MIINIEDDFDLQRIADSGQCFRWKALPSGEYRILNGADCLYIKSRGDTCYDVSCDAAEWEDRWHEYFDFDLNYSSIRAGINPCEDSFLWRASQEEKGIRILRQDPWEMLITFIISQNKNIPAIRQSVELLCERHGERKIDCRGCAYYAFPSPTQIAALDEHNLKECRLGYRWSYVHGAAVAVCDGSLNLKTLQDADEETVVQTLMSLKGVGIKVANCVSLFGLHHINAFPQDVWVKRIVKTEYPQGYPFEHYSPYNGIYQQYMFAHYRHRLG